MLRPTAPDRWRTVRENDGELIEMGEADFIATVKGGRIREYAYFARRNGGDWVDIRQYGNRLPPEWQAPCSAP